jgi:hypothetical protein
VGGYPPSGTAAGIINTGGGGGGLAPGSSGGTGGSGIVIVRYPYTVQTYNFVANAFNAPNIVEASNVFIDLRTINVSNGSILYYTTVGNVTSSDFVTGNTGSFTILNSNALLQFRLANNIVTGNNTKNFGIQIRSGSITGPILTTSNTFIVYSSNVGYYNMTSSGGGGNLYISGDYNVMTFNTSANLNVVSAASIGFTDVEILLVAGGGGPGGSFAGAPRAGGGGGAGGVLYRANATLSAQQYSIVVGGGGGMQGTGGPTTGFSVIAAGGGAGGNNSNYPPPTSGYSGGSGGGSGQPLASGGPSTQNSYGGWFKYGSAGGGAPGGPFPGESPAGSGGGGAGGAGDQFGGGGGGVAFNISGSTVTYAAGGSSTRYDIAPAVAPGTGNGGWGSNGEPPGYPTRISNGSPGVVIVKYRRPTN